MAVSISLVNGRVSRSVPVARRSHVTTSLLAGMPDNVDNLCTDCMNGPYRSPSGEVMRAAQFASLVIVAAALQPIDLALAGNDANFVLYNQHVEERGETEVEIFSDF